MGPVFIACVSFFAWFCFLIVGIQLFAQSSGKVCFAEEGMDEMGGNEAIFGFGFKERLDQIECRWRNGRTGRSSFLVPKVEVRKQRQRVGLS